ncbi:MAG: outer membrane protein assembly factor BamD [Bacteroidetes bacterium]|nr:outer membrane protein assembly factor BamD [Bacteroidota bacterium]
MKWRYLLLAGLMLAILTPSCKFQKLLKSTDSEKKYEMAVNYYNAKDYSRALQIFDQLIGVYRGTEKIDKIYYYYAYCYYEQEDFILASYYFKRYTENFPRGKFAEECSFMSAYCTYLDSPDFKLDQTNTYQAIKDLQLFINTFPESKRLDTCNQLIDQLRSKLEMKAFRIANMYLKMEEYLAAITSYNNILKEFPDTKNAEEIQFLLVKSYYFYGTQSIYSKKKERLEAVIRNYNFLQLSYPNSKFLKEAGTYREKAEILLQEL